MQLWAWILLCVSPTALLCPWNKWIQGESLVWFHFEARAYNQCQYSQQYYSHTSIHTPQHTLFECLLLKYIKFNKIIALWPGLNFICTFCLSHRSGFTRNTHIFTWLNLPRSRCDNIHKRLHYFFFCFFAYLNWIVHLTRMKMRTATGSKWW